MEKQKLSGKKTIVQNSIMNVMAQILSILVQFVIRSFFIRYIGDTLLGLDSALLAVLNIIALAEAGLSNAVVIFLVEPVKQNDSEQVNRILNTFRYIYHFIGRAYLIIAVVLMPFIRLFISNLEIGNELYFYYILLAINGSLTFFLAYRKVLLIADQKMYLTKLIECLYTMLFAAFQILAIVLFKSYVTYLVIRLVQTFTINMVIYQKCDAEYNYLEKNRVDAYYLKKIISAVKSLFAGTVAGYVYGSSDTLVISAFISTVQVVYYNNYYLVANGLKVLISSTFNAMVPLLKEMMVECENVKAKNYTTFRTYNYICNLIAMVLIVPAYVLIQPFISAWVGERFLLSEWIFVLMLADIYICIVQNPMGNYIIASELFMLSKWPDIIGTFLNVVISVALVSRCGLMGILVGTVLSRLIQWGFRYVITYRYCFECGTLDWLIYWLRIAVWVAIIFITSIAARFICSMLPIQSFLVQFIFKGLISILLASAGVVTASIGTGESKILWKHGKTFCRRNKT